MKKFVVTLALVATVCMVTGAYAQEDHNLDISGSFGTASFNLYATRTETTPITSQTLIGKKFISGNSLLNYVAAEIFIDLTLGADESWEIKTIVPDDNNSVEDDSCIRLNGNLSATQRLTIAYRLTGDSDTPALDASIPTAEMPSPMGSGTDYNWFWPSGRTLMSSTSTYTGRQRFIIAVHIPEGTTGDPFPPSGSYSNTITFDLTVQ